ncbi:MAG: protoporphyrinogen oxidase [Acidobacteriota bacterium]
MKFDSIIIGAGISGLVAAYRLKKRGCNILLIESSARVGGVIESSEVEGFLLEAGPNSFRGTHELLDLVDELGLTDELVTADPRAPAYVYSNGELHAVPMSPPALIKTRLLSTSAKLRLLREPFIKRRNPAEESIASFVRRRLGNEVLEKLVAPFLSGVYAGNPEELSVQACFPKLAEFEADAGSILRGGLKAMRASRKQGEAPKRSLRPYRLCSFRQGLGELPKKLAQNLGDSLLAEARVTAIRKSSDGFEIHAEHGGENKRFDCQTLIVAAPAFAAAGLVETIAPGVAELLAGISYASIASVPLAYRAEQVARELDGFGFLAPREEGLRTLGSIWNSSLFAGRTPEGWVVTTNFIGGATDPEAVGLNDEELIRTVHNDLSKVLKIAGIPRRLPIQRWPRAIPQYNIGHAERVAKLETALQQHRGLWIVGNYLHGVSLGDCVKDADNRAGKTADWLAHVDR